MGETSGFLNSTGYSLLCGTQASVCKCRDAVGLERWMDETREQGGHILVERSGTVREVMPLR